MNFSMWTSKDIKFFFLNTVLSSLIFLVLNLYTRTLRVQFEGTEHIQKHLDKGGRIIIASWHQRFFGGFFLPKIFKWSPCIMISQSRDGEFISRVVRHIGWIPVRGSSSRGGKEALRVMVNGVNENRIGGHIVDGPTGPPQIIKPGLLALAMNAEAFISPGIVSYENAWIFNSWDHFMVPKPFSRVLFRFGAISSVPKTINDGEFETLRRQLENQMIKEYEDADNFWTAKKSSLNRS